GGLAGGGGQVPAVHGDVEGGEAGERRAGHLAERSLVRPGERVAGPGRRQQRCRAGRVRRCRGATDQGLRPQAPGRRGVPPGGVGRPPGAVACRGVWSPSSPSPSHIVPIRWLSTAWTSHSAHGVGLVSWSSRTPLTTPAVNVTARSSASKVSTVFLLMIQAGQ